MPSSEPQDSISATILQLNPKDNVGVATGNLEPDQVAAGGQDVLRVRERIATGHKVAIKPIDAGEKIIKWGMPIGSATRPIAPGEAVHLHNMKSDYLPTYTLDGSNPYLP